MFPLDNNLAYLIGVFLGDGHFWKDQQMRLRSIDKEFVEKVNDVILAITGRKGNISTRKELSSWGKQPQWNLIYCDRKLSSYLLHITINKTEIPDDIFSASFDYKIWFIRGLLDSDGWISKGNNNRYQIGFAKMEENVVKGLVKIATSVGLRIGKISKKIYPSGKIMNTIIFSKPNINLFTINRKQKRFRDYRRNILKG